MEISENRSDKVIGSPVLRRFRFFSLIVLGLVSLALVQAQTKKKDKPGKQDFTSSSGTAFGFDDVLKFVEIEAPARMEKALENRGVTFYPTPEQKDKLKAAGATPEILAMIEKKGKIYQPPPPPPAPSTAGPLTLGCAPAECEIDLNGKSLGLTKGGLKRIEGVPLGPQSTAIVDFKKDGYIGQQATIALKAATPFEGKVVLTPTEATLRKFGGQVFDALAATLGPARDAGSYKAAGSATLFPVGSPSRAYNIEARLDLANDRAFLEIFEDTNGKKKSLWRVYLKGQRTEAKGDKRLTGSADAAEMENVIHKFRDYQLAALLARIAPQKSKVTADAPGLDGSSSVTLKAPGVTERYVVSIAANGLPEKLAVNNDSGLGLVTVAYGDYASAGKAKVPKSMDISIDKPKHGMNLRFDSITPATSWADKDFRP